jgi:hypothetical protein
MQQSLEVRIRNRAYELWNMSGREDGQELQHWLAAEQEMLAESKQMIAAPQPSVEPQRAMAPQKPKGRRNLKR